jgi:glutathionyl-hydroquinone reductase
VRCSSATYATSTNIRPLRRYAHALYQMPGIVDTTDIDECKLHYYGMRMVNPSGIVPKGLKLDFTARRGPG